MENQENFWDVFGTKNLRDAFDYQFNDLKGTGHLMGFKAGVHSIPGNENLPEEDLREETLQFILSLLKSGTLIARIQNKDFESSEDAIEVIRQEWKNFPPRDSNIAYQEGTAEQKALWDAKNMFEKEYVKFTFPANGWDMKEYEFPGKKEK